jgi:hypothetical protein
MNKEQLEASQNLMPLINIADQYITAASEFRTCVERQFLLNEVRKTTSDSLGYSKITITFEGVDRNLLSSHSIKLTEGLLLSNAVIDLLNNENQKRLTDLQKFLPKM